jgi:hypothetical protein
VGFGGIEIDAGRLLNRRRAADDAGLGARRRSAGRIPIGRSGGRALKGEPGQLRKVSLNRLESYLASVKADGGAIPEEAQYLAGLTSVQAVFLFPETGDVVIAGPAEAYVDDGKGHVLGTDSGLPVLRLEDLVVALRAFPPGSRNNTVISCSIDPTQQALVQMQQFLASIRGNPPNVRTIVQGLRQAMGNQVVTVGGVSPQTRIARTLVEADYRMKLIGMGMERIPVRIPSYPDLVRTPARQNALTRWYFTPYYQCIRISDAEDAFELEGDRVQLLTQAEFVAQDGQRSETGQRDRASERFVTEFTKQYPALAARVPVFADLSNIMDLSIVAAALQHFDAYDRCRWAAEFINDEANVPTQTHEAIQQVATVVTAVWKGKTLMTPVGGGVAIQAKQALEPSNLLKDTAKRLDAQRDQINLDQLQPNQWWWD